MSTRLLDANFAWSILSLFVRSGAQFLVLPFALVTLGPAEMGIWYLFVGIGAFVAKMDLGFNPSIARGMAFLLAGSRSLSIGSADTASDIDNLAVRKYVASAIMIYKGVFALALSALVITSLWVVGRAGATPGHAWLSAAWLVYCLATVVNIAGNAWVALLNGANRIAEVQKAILWSNAIGVVITALGLMLGYGLMALSVGALITALASRISCCLMFRRAYPIYLPQPRDERDSEWIMKIWPSAWRSGVVDLGAYLIYFSNIILIGHFVGNEAAGKYGLTFQLFQLAFLACGLPLTVALPKLNALFAQSKVDQALQIFIHRHILGLVAFTIAACVIIFFGQSMLNAIGSKSQLLPPTLVAFFGLIMLLEFNHGYFAVFLMAANRIPFVLPALLSGLAISLLGLFVVREYSVAGLLTVVFLVQLACNNWWVPLRVHRELAQMRLGLKV